jgi:hypothetical protein
MKKTMSLLLGLAFISTVNAQVGINTTSPDPSSVLEIESNNAGILIPRLTSTERDNISNPEVSLLIFNTTNNTYEYNSGSAVAPIWSPVSYNASVKYSNSDITTNLNSATTIDAPIFGNLEWNDDISLYTVSGNTITINSSGRYRVTINIYYSAPDVPGNNDERRIAVLAQLALDDTPVGTVGATGYIRHDNNHDQASINFVEVIPITSGEVLTIQLSRGGNIADAFFDSANTSNITIEKLN